MEMIMTLQEYYNDAKVKGKREYNKLKARGLSGHLSSLDGMLKDVEIVGTISLGACEVPLHKVVGTYYHARRMMFSKSFYPLETDATEFSAKWIEVCRAQLEEGIRDAVKVYEYMNYYYVMEGNKRVSVLKYFDAASINAEITRLVPKFDPDDEDVVLYYAFLEFYDVTKLVSIWLSKPRRYKRLLGYLESYAPKDIDEKERYQFFQKSVYYPFRRLYKEAGGDALNMTTGDAFLLYAKLYGIPDELDERHAVSVMPSLIKELSNYGDHEEHEIVTSIEEAAKPGLFASLVSPKKIKVGFVYARDTEKSGWTYSHDLGRKYIETAFRDQVTTGTIDNVPEDDSAYEIIKEFAEDGDYDVVFTTSEVYRRATLKCAIELPKIKFFNCSGNRPYVHMSNYFGRTYEPRFLNGIIAGALTKTGIVGYTATEANPEVIASINAFALGMKLVNPEAKLLVTWTGVWNNPIVSTDISNKLIDLGADMISNKNLIVPREVTWDYGVYAMLCDIDPDTKKPVHYFASPIWKWGKFYEKMIRSVLNGTYQRLIASDNAAQKIVNFWWGMDAGVIDLYLAENLIPTDTLKLVTIMKKMIISEQYHPFIGPVYDQEGTLRIAKDSIPTPEEIMSMNWLVEGVQIIE